MSEPTNQAQRRQYLIRTLLEEQPRYRNIPIPGDAGEQERLLRSLMNVRPPRPIGERFLAVQDQYLRDNRGMTGCYVPCHRCIDNCIHTRAGVQLRLECASLMAKQGHEEATGRAKITGAYNLPCRYVIHTVGPVVSGALTEREEAQLASCYLSCLKLAEENGLKSIAFCCISTGEFHFPNDRAAEIAVETVRTHRTNAEMKVIFNVFKDIDYQLYQQLLAAD